MATPIDVSDHLRGAILARLGDQARLVGKSSSLARAFGVTTAALLSALRDLLEDGRIVVEMDPGGRLSVRLGSRLV